MPRFSDIKRAILRYYIKNLVADASCLDMGHIIERIAFFLIALGLNCIFPSPVAFFSVTVLAILVWKCLYLRYVQDMTYYYGKAIMESRNNHMVRDSAYVDLALYFCYLIATIVGEWIQKKKLTSEICRLKQENGELVREKEQLVQDQEHLQHEPPHLGTTLLAKLRLHSVKLFILLAVLILGVAGHALMSW